MTNEEAIRIIREIQYPVNGDNIAERDSAIEIAIKALEQEPCEDAISREDLEECKELMTDVNGDTVYAVKMSDIRQLHSVTQKLGHCKDCKYFEYDSVAKVDGIPLIVAHEICSRWSDGCKTKEDGYCFLFEPQERSDKE